jgi:hypothetical protein
MSERMRCHALCYPFPALVSYSRVFRLMGVFGRYNAMRRAASALRKFKKKTRDGLVIKIVLCHELAKFRQLGSRVFVLAYVLVGLHTFEGRRGKGVCGVAA